MKTNYNKSGTNVAILDSGINLENIETNKQVVGGISFIYDPKTGEIINDDCFEDENGHGTSCASMIKRIAPDTNFYIVKILDNNAKTNSKALLIALNYLLEKDIRLINLSLATIEEKYFEEISEICNLLKQRGKIIVCSLDNRNNRSFPAVLDSVIGVRGSIFNSSEHFWYNKTLKIQCVADIIPVYIPTINGAYWLFGGNSKATALFTGHIANILSQHPDISFEQLNEILEQRAYKNNWNDNNIDSYIDFYGDITPISENFGQENMKLLISILRDNLGSSEAFEVLISRKKLYNPQIGVNKFNCYNIIKDIENKFGVKLCYSAITFNTFTSVYTLLDFIERSEKNVQEFK